MYLQQVIIYVYYYLISQVKSLLYDAELSRGTILEDKPDEDSHSKSNISSDCLLPDSSSMNNSKISGILENVSSADNIIDEYLVTWSNLSELQSQNQRLLCVARDLASQLEKREMEEKETMTRIEELSTRLEILSSDLEVARMSTREARNEVGLVSRQRDQYRFLLEKYDIDISIRNEDNLEDDEGAKLELVSSDRHRKGIYEIL